MFDDVIVVYKFIGDLMFFVTGSQDENELILGQVLQGFYESISLLLRHARWPKCILENCDHLLTSTYAVVRCARQLDQAMACIQICEGPSWTERAATRHACNLKLWLHLRHGGGPWCRSAVEKKTVLENLDLVLLVMDETVDGG